MLQTLKSQLDDCVAGDYVVNILTYGIGQVQIFRALEKLYGPFAAPYLEERRESCIGLIVDVLSQLEITNLPQAMQDTLDILEVKGQNGHCGKKVAKYSP